LRHRPTAFLRKASASSSDIQPAAKSVSP